MDRLSVFRQLPRPIDLEGPMPDQETKQGIRVVQSDKGETDQTNIARLAGSVFRA